MTLTALLPTLRRSIPDPISLDRWPELTRVTTTDVFVAGVSLLRVVDLFGTPCAHAAAAVVPGSGGCPSPSLRASAIVVRIVAIRRSPTGALLIEVDGPVGGQREGSESAPRNGHGFEVIHSETRLIGRASTAKVAAAILVESGPGARWSSAGIRHWPLAHGLPADLAVGDLLALPCRGSVSSWQLAGCGRADAADAAYPPANVESWLSSLA